MRSVVVPVALFSLSLTLVAGCGGDDGTGHPPVDAAIDGAPGDATPDAAACAAGACASLIGGGDLSGAAWGDVEADACQESIDAHDALNDCACVRTNAQGGCANICDAAQNGTGNPNFCNGVPALFSCMNCLQQSCQTEIDTCTAN